MTAINVTEAHLTEGVRSSCSRCPVALAIAETFPEATYVWVGGATADIEIDGREVSFGLPGEVEEFIGRFDDDGFGEPFTFTVDYPAVTA